jgi:hypothetical protein
LSGRDFSCSFFRLRFFLSFLRLRLCAAVTTRWFILWQRRASVQLR